MVALLLFEGLAPSADAVAQIQGPQPPPGTNVLVGVEVVPLQVALEATAEAGAFAATQPISVRVVSILPRWRLICVARPAKGPRGQTIAPEVIFATLGRSPADPAKRYAGPPLSLGEPIVVAVGGVTFGTGPGGVVEVNTLLLTAGINPLLPPGDYTGAIDFMLDDAPQPSGGFVESLGMRSKIRSKNGDLLPGWLSEFELERLGPRSVMVASLRWVLHHGEFFSIELDPHEMIFGSVEPGINEARNVVRMSVLSNQPRVRVNAALTELRATQGEGLLPTSALALGWGTSPEAARISSRSAPLGRSGFDWVSPRPGLAKIYIHARVDVGFDQAPGNYSGLLRVTVGGL